MNFKRTAVGRRLATSLAVLLASVGLIGLTGCDESLDQSPVAADVTEVDVDDNFFEPRVIEVPLGTEVTWARTGDRDHNVVSEGFQSSPQAEGDFAHRFDQPGSFEYACTLHGGMTGRVVVLP